MVEIPQVVPRSSPGRFRRRRRESDPFIIKDAVFQRTFLGPMLWNVFFSDIAAFVDSIEFEEQRFADDLSVFKEFDKAMLNDEILSELHKCQKQVHELGRPHQIIFDPAKEEFLIIHHHNDSSNIFRFLGPIVDTKFTMRDAVRKITGKVRGKLKALENATRLTCFGLVWLSCICRFSFFSLSMFSCAFLRRRQDK